MRMWYCSSDLCAADLYLAGIVRGWWYLLKLIEKPGAPMARRHADDMVFYATLGILIGGRLGYVLFYRPEFYFENPLEILQLWDGGMSFHGGVIGVSLGILWMARKHGLDRSEEHTSELPSLMRISYAVFCL